ncbi:MAG: methionine--tRNA ligase [Candidatus Aminicenantes bacterium]|nr:methionine--tRNA ligase [Candidatus Aminicenantes bacterium]
MEKKSKPAFYITTPIYYVNDVLHIGHAYTTIIADALARFKKQAGYDVFFLTGTDEHGQKIEKAAAEKGLKPRELADMVVGRAKDLWKALNISYDFFIRTTEPFHEKGVQKVFQTLLDKGDIYKGTYQGWYCVSNEHFLADDVPLEKDGTKICPECRVKATVVEESSYFFKLSAYARPLLDFYEKNPNFVRPQGRMNEVTSFVRGGLKDLSITRTTVKWGIPVPGDPAHTIYVWFDALHNYLTGIGYDGDLDKFERFWPATIHLIGKDILRFHAVFWPAFLMAAGFKLPECVYGHGWWLKDDAKMSKSKGNVLDPYAILKPFGSDPLRYFLLREIPIGNDGNFSHEGFIHRVNSDLANDLGNLVHRTLTMVRSYFKGTFPELAGEGPDDRKVREGFERLQATAFDQYSAYAVNRALEEIWVFINAVNKYLADNEPWKLAKDPAQKPRLARVLYQAVAAIRGITYLIYPVMPGSAEKIWDFLGENEPIQKTLYSGLAFDGLKPGRTIKEPVALFPRVDLKEFLAEEAKPSVPVKSERIKTEGTMDVISYDEFKRMDLRAALILKAEKVEGAQKLLKLQIDLGTEQRQIVAGIAETYKPEDLVGKKLIVIANLKPAVIRGVESAGMLLAAVVDDKAYIPFFTDNIPAGAKVK